MRPLAHIIMPAQQELCDTFEFLVAVMIGARVVRLIRVVRKLSTKMLNSNG